MNWCSRHGALSVVIDDLDIGWPRRPLWPFEADSPLLIDTNAVLTPAIALEGFEAIAWQSTEVFQPGGRIQSIEPDFGLARETREVSHALTASKPLRAFVSVA